MQRISIAVAALLYGADAIMVQREPLLSNTDFFVTAAPGGKAKPGHPQDYFVPNFGQDFDVKATLKHAADQEARLKHTWIPDALKPKAKAPPVDYFVPDFGVDRDIVDTQKNLADSEARLGRWNVNLVQIDEAREPLLSNAGHFVTAAPKTPEQKEKHPKDYFVPNFGVDRDVEMTLKHIKDQEGRLKHTYVPDALKPKSKIPLDYPVPNFGLDADIVATQNHLRQTERNLGPWNINQLMLEEFMQIDAEMVREPLLAAGVVETASPYKHFPKEKWPINYAIVNAGPDHDIASTHKHLAEAEAQHKHTWSMEGKKFDEVPKVDAEFKL